MRGKVPAAPNPFRSNGITPAYAGKSFCCESRVCNLRDHPRICGEKLLTCERIDFRLGSPPHMRGKVFELPLMVYTQRITPAYAGKRHSMHQRKTSTKDHPRICGEKPLDHLAHLCAQGSPPHMRGKVTSALLSQTALRITPAYAGKSCFGQTNSIRV